MVDALQGIGDKLVAIIMATAAIANGLFTTAQTPAVPPNRETATIYSAATSSTRISGVVIHQLGVNGTLIAETPAAGTTIGTSTQVTGSLPVIKLSPLKVAATKTVPAPAPKAQKTPAPKAPAAPTVMTTPVVMTSQWLLDNTELSFKQKRDGTFEAVFTVAVNAQTLAWGITDTSVGGSGGIPRFAFSASCDPPLEIPAPDLPDQIPFFKVRTTYDCTIGFAATSGNDQRLLTKKLHLTTGAGQLVIFPPSSMNTVLTNDTNNGGLVFNNQDADPVTVTKLTVDLSYTGLSATDRPLVLRILDPVSEATLYDYHMENMPAVPGTPYTYATTGVEIPVRFTLGAASEKVLPVQLLGVHRLSVVGSDPRVTITLRALASDQSDVPVVLTNSEIHWTCVVTLAAYDPNATSGPFATGLACR
jgi:hypothetical protein